LPEFDNTFFDTTTHGIAYGFPRTHSVMGPTMVQTRRAVQQAPIANGRANGYAEKHTQDDVWPEKTDYSRWRLLDESGRQTWHYLTDDSEVKKWPQSVADKYHLGLPTVGSIESIAELC
jgi:hypothetical protein